MDINTAIQEIRASYKCLFPADKVNKGIICPLCGSGSGPNGTGITENPKNPGQLSCWKCNFKGDVIDLYREKHRVDFKTALHMIASELGIEIKVYQGPKIGIQRLVKNRFNKAVGKKQSSIKKKLENNEGEIMDYTKYYDECKTQLNDPAAISYLQEVRKISLETATKYHLGYDPLWVSPTTMKKQCSGGKQLKLKPTARIIIPVNKNFYVARAISCDVPVEYTKMNETGGGHVDIFNMQAMYNGSKFVFITEGVFDALSVIDVGVDVAAIALNSTSNTRLFIEQLKQRATQASVVVCMDSDESGIMAASELESGLKELSVNYILADINCGFKDPNDALIHNREAFRQAVICAQKQVFLNIKSDNVSHYIDELMQSEIDLMKRAANKKTGFVELDEKSGGLYPGLYVIAATSSLGKTTFAGQIADNLAIDGHDVLFFSMEQSRLELVTKSLTRVIAQRYDKTISSLLLRKGSYQDKLKEAMLEYKTAVSDRLSIIECDFSYSASSIDRYIERYIKYNNCSPVVFIDYLQILQPDDSLKKASTKEAVDNTVKELKQISKKYNLTVFVISSVNRTNYLTPIDFESLKESGGIEYTADVIWGLQLDCINDPLFEKSQTIREKREKIREAKTKDPRLIELICLKNRYGVASYSCKFNYHPSCDFFVQSKSSESSRKSKQCVGNGKPIALKI